MDMESWSTLQLLTIAARLIRQRANASLAPLALTTARVGVLEALSILGPVSQAELASHLGVKGQSLVTSLALLEVQGFITRQECSRDRRKNIVSLTASGQSAVRTAHQAQTPSSTSNVLDEERALRHLLKELISNLRPESPY
jgi:DNA-binding MarR family transcriptional regulator